MRAYLKKFEASYIGLFDVLLWSILLSVIVYSSVAGIDQLEYAIYNLVEHTIN